MIRRGPHKYLRDNPWDAQVIFEVDSDPDEQWNVRWLDADGAITAALSAELDRLLAAPPAALPVLDDRG